jgi:alanine dehydrogenase
MKLQYWSAEGMRKAGISIDLVTLYREIERAWTAKTKGSTYGAKVAIQLDPKPLRSMPQYLPFREEIDDALDWKTSAMIAVDDKYSLVKFIVANPLNHHFGRARSNITCLLSDKFTGQLLWIFDGSEISSARTGAYAIKVLNLFFPEKRDLRIFLFGAGKVAECIIKFLAHEPQGRISSVVIRSGSNTSFTLVKKFKNLVPFRMEAVTDSQFLMQAHYVITATTSCTPLYAKDELAAGVTTLHLAADETPAAHIDDVLKHGIVACDSIQAVSDRDVQSLSYYFSRQGKVLSQEAPKYGIQTLGEMEPLRDRKEGQPAHVVCVGEAWRDLAGCSNLYETFIKLRPGEAPKMPWTWEVSELLKPMKGVVTQYISPRKIALAVSFYVMALLFLILAP